MFAKSLIAAAALATVAAVTPAPAEAKVNLDIHVGGGGWGPGYYGYYGHYPRHHRFYGYRPVYPRYVKPYWGISCGKGAQVVDWSGYSKVRTLECSGNAFTYKARKNGRNYIVVVSRRTGQIIQVSRA